MINFKELKSRIFTLLGVSLMLSSCWINLDDRPKYGSNYKIYRSEGNVTQEDVKLALTSKKKYPDEVSQMAEVSRSIYSFGYFPAEMSKGMPVKAFQNVYEKYRCLSDNKPVYFTEMFNDMVTFEAFKTKVGDLKTNKYYDPLYLITDYSSDGIFYSDAKMAYWENHATTVGTPIHLRYRKKIKDVKYLGSVYFHEGYPQKEKVISIEIPSWLTVDILEMNFDGYAITKSSKKVVMDDLVEVNGKGKAPKKEKSKVKPDKIKIVTYTIKDLNAYKKETNAVGPAYNLPHIIILCKNLDEKLAKPYAMKEKKVKKENTKKVSKNDPVEVKRRRQQGNYKKQLVANLDDLYQWYNEIVSLTKNDTTITGKKAREITVGCKTKKEKMEKVFYWVQDNIRYVAFEDGLAAFKPEPCQEVLANRYGDCKGMANLLKNMLTSVGIDAHITWIGTKHIPYDYRIPSVIVDNHMICTVFLDGKTYFLDGTEDYIGIEDYAHRIQGKPVLIANGSTFLIDTVPDLPVERNLVSRTAGFRIEQDKLVGLVTEVLKGEPKTQLIWAVNNLPGEEKEKAYYRYLRESYHYILPDSIKASDITNRTADFKLDYKLTLKNHVLRKGNSVFVNPDYSYELENKKVDTARIFDLEFSHKINMDINYMIQIPSGYQVAFMPPRIEINNPEFYLLVSYTREGNIVRYVKKLQVKKGVITKANFLAWNNMLYQLQSSYNHYLQFQM